MKAVIFARVSTQEQAQEGYSIESQIERLTEYCKRHRFEIIEIFDVQESSTKGEKKEFNRMISLIRSHKEKIAIVVDKVDRLNRSISDLPTLEDLMYKLDKTEIHFLDAGKIDKHATPAQKLMLRMLTAVGNAHNDGLSDHGKKTYIHKVTNGECPGPAPVGYLNKNDEAGHATVIIDTSRKLLVKQMFEVYSLGSTSLGDLEKFAKKHNLTNTFFKHKESKTLSKNVISNMLKNPFYYGFIHNKQTGRLYPHKYDRIISQELFDACQKVTEERSAKNNRKQSIQTAKEGKEFIFKSLVKCGTTGRIVTCDRKDKGRIKTSTYLMPWDPENPKKKLWVNENEILAEIEKVFKSMEFPKEMLAEVQEKLQGAHHAEKDYYKSKITELNNRLGIAHAKLDRLVDMKLTDSITEDMFAKKRTEIEKEIANLKTDVAMHDIADEKFKTLVVTVFSLASEAHELFLYSTMSERRSFIDYVFSDITLTGKKLSYSLRCPFDLMVNIASRQDWLRLVSIFRTEKRMEVDSFIKNSYNNNIQQTRLVA